MKGLGSIIIAVLFLSIFLLSVIPLVLHMYTTSINRTPVYEDPVYRVFQVSVKTMSRDIIAFFNASSLELQIANRGGMDLEIDRGVLYTICGSNEEVYMDTKTRMSIPSGQTVSLQMSIDQNICRNPRPKTLHIITRDGVVLSSTVITIEDIQDIVHGNRTYEMPTAAITSAIIVIPMKIKHEDDITSMVLLTEKGFEIYTLDNMDRPTRLQSYTNFLSRGMSGGTTTRYVWSLHTVRNSVSISISNRVVRNLWIGYDPRDPTKYNIIITADNITINVGGQSVSLSSDVRVKIYGFKPSTAQGILQLGGSWVTKPSQDVADYTFLTTSSITTRLTMNGIADKIEIYTRTTGTDSSYNPYIMFMNTDGSLGSAGILFTTIDRIWGFHNSRNEDIDRLLDYSTTSLVLVYRGYSISNTNNSAVVIAINYRFHDNEGGDAMGTSVDRPIMFVGLVDSNNVIYSYRSYTFRELTRYEDTYPPTAQAQSSLVFIPLPPSSTGKKVFYVFIAIQDPYSYSGSLDDLDFTLCIESLSIIPLS